MQDSSLVPYSGPRLFDYDSYHPTWYGSSSYDDAGLFGEPLSSTQDESYDDSYYLTYEDVDDYSSRPWYKNRGTNQDYRGTEAPYSGSATCLGDYTFYFGCMLEKDESSGYAGDEYGSSNYSDNMRQPDYSEYEWLGYGGLDFGGGSMEDDIYNFEYSSSWANWEQTTLYERIFASYMREFTRPGI